MDPENTEEPIRIYLDDAEEPFKVEQAPLRFNFNTIQLPDGDHVMRIEASNGLAPPTIKRIPFTVRNGVAVTVSGLESNQTIGGQVELIINAYAGSSEVDFEPRKAETPQPIPTWAWVLFLAVGAWTLFYLLNPHTTYDAYASSPVAQTTMGDRLYTDTCARCHGETGDGQALAGDAGGFLVPPLRDNTRYALADQPLDLLLTVILGREGTMMPTWGPILTTDEVVAVVNHVRQSWRHDASIIEFSHRNPPPEITRLEKSLERALTNRKGPDAETLSQCCWPQGLREPTLFRTDGVRAETRKEVEQAWRDYIEALGDGGRVAKFKLTERRYHFDPESLGRDGAIVIGAGRVFLEAQGKAGVPQRANGRFIRVYQLYQGSWSLILDFADIPMGVGCEVDTPPDCPVEPGDPGAHDPNDTEPDTPVDTGGALGFDDITKLLADLGYSSPRAPHGHFWELPYEKFIAFSFPADPDVPEIQIKLVVPGDADASNLVRAFEGTPLLALDTEEGTTFEYEIERMPKNKPPLDPALIGAIRKWIDAGCPKEAGAGGAPPPGPIADAGNQPGPGPAADGPLGYAGVKSLLADMGYTSPRAPHGNFWELSYEAFIALKFPYDPDAPSLILHLVVPGDPDASNLLRAMEGREVLVHDTEAPDDPPFELEIPRMPKNKPPVDKALLDRLRAWIAAGCPEEPGGAPHKSVGGASAPDGGAEDGAAEDGDAEPPPAAEEEGGAEDGGAEDGGAEDGAAEDAAAEEGGEPTPPPAAPLARIGFPEVQAMLKALGKRPTTVPHGAFWEDLTYQEFVAFRFPREFGDEEGTYRLLVPWDADASNLVKALRDGKGVVRDRPDGERVVEDIPRMPRNGRPIAPEQLALLVEWIDAGCPERAGEPTALPRPGG